MFLAATLVGWIGDFGYLLPLLGLLNSNTVDAEKPRPSVNKVCRAWDHRCSTIARDLSNLFLQRHALVYSVPRKTMTTLI